MAQEAVTEELLEEEIEKDQYLLFNIDAQTFGIQAMRVQEISRIMEATEVPNAPAYIEGILNLRGRLATIINFRKKFGYPPKAYDDDTRIILISQDEFPIGVIVDAVSEVIKVPDRVVQSLPETTTTAISRSYVTGVGMLEDTLVILLDVDRMLDKVEVGEAGELRQAVSEAQSIQVPGPEPETEESPEGAVAEEPPADEQKEEKEEEDVNSPDSR